MAGPLRATCGFDEDAGFHESIVHTFGLEPRSAPFGSRIETFQNAAAPFGPGLVRPGNQLGKEFPDRNPCGLGRLSVHYPPSRQQANRRGSGSRIERFQRLAATFGSALIPLGRQVCERLPIRDPGGLGRRRAHGSSPQGTTISAPELSVSKNLRRYSVPRAPSQEPRSRTIPTTRPTVARFASDMAPQEVRVASLRAGWPARRRTPRRPRDRGARQERERPCASRARSRPRARRANDRSGQAAGRDWQDRTRSGLEFFYTENRTPNLPIWQDIVHSKSPSARVRNDCAEAASAEFDPSPPGSDGTALSPPDETSKSAPSHGLPDRSTRLRFHADECQPFLLISRRRRRSLRKGLVKASLAGSQPALSLRICSPAAGAGALPALRRVPLWPRRDRRQTRVPCEAWQRSPRRRTGLRSHRFPSGRCNRDRGTPHDVTPPTPPGIRVRTTAVRPS